MKLQHAVLAVVGGLLVIVGYQYVYENGLWSPTSSTRKAIQNALGRADRITAQQAQENLDKLLKRAEAGEKLDPAELRKAIEAVAKDAGELERLSRDAEAVSRGESSVKNVAKPAVVNKPQPPEEGHKLVSSTPPQPAPAPTVDASSRPTPTAMDRLREPAARTSLTKFLSSEAAITRGEQHGLWHYPSRTEPLSIEFTGVKVTVRASGEMGWGYKLDGRYDSIGPSGLPQNLAYDLKAKPSQPDWSRFPAPDAPYFALLISVCSPAGCRSPVPFETGGIQVCVPSRGWLEFALNEAIGQTDEWHRAHVKSQGTYLVRFDKEPVGVCQ